MDNFITQSTFASSGRPRTTAFAAALLLGLIADQIVRTPGRPGLNVATWAIAGVAALFLLSQLSKTSVSRETKWLVGGAVAFACLLVLRDAGALALFCLFSAVLLLGLAAGRGAQAWAARAHIIDVLAAAARTAALVALGPFGWSIGEARRPESTTNGRAWSRRVRIAARGTVMALPPLLALTALLTSADPVFEGVLHNALFTGIEPLLEHLAFAGVIAWLTSGYMRAFLIEDDVVMQRAGLPRPSMSASEITVALTLVNILFIAFMVVQVRYLFGGASLVEVTKGLTYAQYARRGFFELVVAAALVVPVLLVADWAAAENEERSRRAMRATSALLVLLLVGVLASAAYRMRLYQQAYGLTEDRLYGSVFIAWLMCVLALLAATVLRGQRRGLAFGAIVAGLTCIVALHALNPHALIARVNVSRAAAGAQVDARYLRTLSADAVPTLIEELPELPVVERCSVATMMRKRWSGERPGGWKTWNLSDARARRMVGGLRAVAGCV